MSEPRTAATGLRARRIAPLLGVCVCVCGLGPAASGAFASYSGAVLSDTPQSYFRMDDANSTMLNQVGSVPNGTHLNNPVLGAGPGPLVNDTPNIAVRYAASPDQDRSRFSVDTYSQFSLEYFVITLQPVGGSIVNWYDGFGLVDGELFSSQNDAGTALVANGKVGFGLGNPDTTIASTTAVNDGSWHHVVATSNGAGVMKLYVDGALEAQSNSGPSGPRSNSGFAIGSLNTDILEFEGSIDEVAFYTSELTAADVGEHYAARLEGPSPPPRQITVLGSVEGGGGNGTLLGTDGMNCPEFSCGGNSPEGSINDYVAIPAAGSRFGGFDPNSDGSLDCVPTAFDRCTVHVDNAHGSERVTAIFHLAPDALGGALNGANGTLGTALEQALDNSVNPKKAKHIKFKDFPLDAFNGELGTGAGELVTLISKSKVDLIGSDGATLVGPDGATLVGNAGNTLTTKAPGLAELLSDGGGGLISDNGSGLIGDHGGGLIGPDGATLISDNGSGLIGDAGSGRRDRRREAAAKPKPKYKAFALGGYRVTLTDDPGTIRVSFEFSKDGRKIIKTVGQMNAALKKTVVPLNATLIELVQPADTHGTGGSLEQIKVK